MSWAIEFVARTKEEAAKEIDVQREKYQHFPAAAADALKSFLSLWPEQTAGMGLHVRSSGHVDAYSGSAETSVRNVPLA